ncbi:hypothetical protein ZIOFF_062405 [Zingiber officinale]|uniref:Uncharacterized protein n=1 Tax=Zingiber officinale TaxID=94328 RepID=A0A8J5F0B3_ZINOF|nr:hypothetical protein ZIOFF_062405 [Zingiber officinale]
MYKMACMKLGSKPDAFHQQGQAWLIKNSDEEDIVTRQADVPGGAQAFELVAKF